MKKTLIILIMIMGFLFTGLHLMSQSPPPPPGDGHGTGDNQLPGGGAPLSSGLGVLLLLSSVYGGYKIYQAKKKIDVDNN